MNNQIEMRFCYHSYLVTIDSIKEKDSKTDPQ